MEGGQKGNRGPLSSQENDREMKVKKEKECDKLSCKHQRCADLQGKQMDTGGSQGTRKKT